MTKESQLTGHELDAAVCQALEIAALDTCANCLSKLRRLCPCEPSGPCVPRFPPVSTDLNACREAELEMEARGLIGNYVLSLGEMVVDTRISFYAAIVYADAQTRCRAMLAAIRSANA